MEVDSDSDDDVPLRGGGKQLRPPPKRAQPASDAEDMDIDDDSDDEPLIAKKASSSRAASDDDMEESSSESEEEELDMETFDTQRLVKGEEDQKYLDSLGEFEREGILAERFEEIKAAADLKRALRENK